MDWSPSYKESGTTFAPALKPTQLADIPSAYVPPTRLATAAAAAPAVAVARASESRVAGLPFKRIATGVGVFVLLVGAIVGAIVLRRPAPQPPPVPKQSVQMAVKHGGIKKVAERLVKDLRRAMD